MMRTALVIIHVVAASVWVGGHLLLALRYLPEALKKRDPTIVTGFEARFEPVGLPALFLQVVTGLWLIMLRLPREGWPSMTTNHGFLLDAKLALLALTVILAVHARLRLIPSLDAERLPALAKHIVAVTLAAVLFVVVGVLLRFEPLPG
jgi:putative copper export protein